MWKDKEFKVDNGESQIEKFKSMEYFLNKMFDNSSNEDVIIVTHGNLLGIILKFYFNRPFILTIGKSCLCQIYMNFLLRIKK